LYFSTGALVIPLAIEIITSFSNGSNTVLYVVGVLIAIYILTMIMGFIMPVFDIKAYVDRQKEKIILESWNKILRLIDEFKAEKELNIKKGIELYFEYNYRHNRLLEIRDYPFDGKVFVELSLSFILPLGVILFEIYTK
jgi:hypothetical protein